MKKNTKIVIGLSIAAVTAGAAFVAYELFRKRLHTGCIYGGCHDENLDGIPGDFSGEDISADCIDYVDICSGEGLQKEESNQNDCCVSEETAEIPCQDENPADKESCSGCDEEAVKTEQAEEKTE